MGQARAGRADGPRGLSFRGWSARAHDGRPAAAPPVPAGGRGEPREAVGHPPGACPHRAPDDAAARRDGGARCSSRWPACTAALHPKADLALLQRAYDVAEAKHDGQKRKSGDPYITHPLAVATILAELGMDTTTLVAALLHDTVEDTDYSLDRLRDGLRRGGRAPRRRRHQAGQGRAGHRRRGGDDPQDGRGDGPRPAGAGHQAVRPAAQHAHDALPAAGEAGQEGPRDARGAGPAGAPARDGHGQVGARGPLLRDPAPQEVLRDRPAGRHQGAVPRHLPQAGHRRGDAAARRRRASPPPSRAGPSTTTRSTGR